MSHSSFYAGRAAALFLAVLFLLLPAPSTARAAGRKPVLRSDRSELYTGEAVILRWKEPDAQEMSLWRRREDTKYELVGGVSNVSDGFSVRLSEPGQWYFSLMARYGGEWQQSDEVGIRALCGDEDEACRYLSQKGMSNTWNLLFLIYENADINGFRKSFSPKEIAEIKRYAATIKYTMEGVTQKRMLVGTVDVLQVSEPIRSASANPEGPYRTLRFGPGGDVNFDYLLDHKDINYVIVYAPLAGLRGTDGWMGLSPFIIGSGDTACGALVINAVDLKRTYYTMDGKTYSEEIAIIVHELLHGVEYYSSLNGWNRFEPLHNVEENGYRFEHGNYLWYRDLTANRLKNGHSGFRKDSFYVPHRRISEDQAGGWHYDSDKEWRYYVNGLPK